MSAVLKQFEPVERGLPHLDKTSDLVYAQQEAEDAIVNALRDSVYAPNATGYARINGRVQDNAVLLFEATDSTTPGVPSGVELTAFVIGRAMHGDKEAVALVDKLIAEYARNNFEVQS